MQEESLSASRGSGWGSGQGSTTICYNFRADLTMYGKRQGGLKRKKKKWNLDERFLGLDVALNAVGRQNSGNDTDV